jgi:hypothetical protein
MYSKAGVLKSKVLSAKHKKYIITSKTFQAQISPLSWVKKNKGFIEGNQVSMEILNNAI